MQALHFYGQKRWRRDRLDAFFRQQQAMKVVKERVFGLVRDGPVVIGYGNANFQGATRGPGQRIAPTKTIRRTLEREAKASGGWLELVDEFRCEMYGVTMRAGMPRLAL